MNKNTWNRKILASLTENEKDALAHSDDGIEILNNEEIMVITMTEMNEFNNQFEIMGNERLTPNMMLLLSPYSDNTYVRADDARSQLAVDKAMLTIRFCSLLGAKSVKVIDFKQVDLDKESEGKFNGGNKATTGEASVKHKSLEKIRNQISTSAIAIGGKPKFDIAEKLLKKHRLNSDPFFKNLFEMVKDYEGEENRIGVITQSVLLTHSMQDSLEIIGKVNFPTGFVRGSYKSSLDQKVQIFMTLRISFLNEIDDNSYPKEIDHIESTLK